MFQVLPVANWVSSIYKNNTAVEMNDDMEKEDFGKDTIDYGKEKITQEKFVHSNIIVVFNCMLYCISSENAIILHHSEICTPPPNSIC